MAASSYTLLLFLSIALRVFAHNSSFCSSSPSWHLSCALQTLPPTSPDLSMCQSVFSSALDSPIASSRDFVPFTPTSLVFLVVQVLPHRGTCGSIAEFHKFSKCHEIETKEAERPRVVRGSGTSTGLGGRVGGGFAEGRRRCKGKMSTFSTSVDRN